VEVTLLEQLERQTLADRQALIGRVEANELPWFPRAAAELRERWASEPAAAGQLAKGLSTEEAELRQALGVA
jgi:hypothetical protein